jgi:hypothetical protein
MLLIKYNIKMFVSLVAAIFMIIIHFTCSLTFCHINTATDVHKYMLLHNKPTTPIFVNHMINKYSKRRGETEYEIKNCIEPKNKGINIH